MVLTLPFALTSPLPVRWIASSIVVIGTALVGVYWGMWWKRQRGYFATDDAQEAQGDDK